MKYTPCLKVILKELNLITPYFKMIYWFVCVVLDVSFGDGCRAGVVCFNGVGGCDVDGGHCVVVVSGILVVVVVVVVAMSVYGGNSNCCAYGPCLSYKCG